MFPVNKWGQNSLVSNGEYILVKKSFSSNVLEFLGHKKIIIFNQWSGFKPLSICLELIGKFVLIELFSTFLKD